MREDLLDAQASVDWAIAQVPVLQRRFETWQGSGPYELVVESDLETADKLIVAYQRLALDRLIPAEIGAIINAIRCSLDLLAASLATRNGVNPSPKTHFPIYKFASDFLHATKRIEKEKWLSDSQIAKIKSLKPYKGGDRFIYPLHQLDILRKHERLITVHPIASSFWYGAYTFHGRPDFTRLNDKTILLRFPANAILPLSKGNTNLASEISFNEPSLGFLDEPAILLIRMFAGRVGEIIRLFDS